MVSGVIDWIKFYLVELGSRWVLFHTTRRVAAMEQPKEGQRPVVFFHASTRIRYLSFNAAFSSLAAWGLRLSGIPVVHFVCRAGMSRCVLESDPDDHLRAMDCDFCTAQSRRAYAGAKVYWFDYQKNAALAEAVAQLDVAGLIDLEFEGFPLGQIALPSIRWRMRRHHLENDTPTLYIYRQFILSAYRVSQEFTALLDEADPAAVVVFNGMMFPEAVACWTAGQRGIPVVTHETGYQPFTGYFTHGEATARLVDLPEGFELSEAQNARLDGYLEQRFEGRFAMAGVQFWPQMRGLDQEFLEKAGGFEQVVPVFTNVIFDTSQPHANTVFEHMFSWLDAVLEIIKTHPETLFVIRAHPDEMRPGSDKQSRDTVRQWVQRNRAARLPNLVYVDSLEYVSSYALVQKAKFIMVYNSSIGLEGALMGVPVLAGGEAWYMRYPTVFFPQTPEGFHSKGEELLNAEKIEVPEAFRHNARRLIYYQNFRVALPFDRFLENHVLQGYVRLKPFSVEDLLPENSPAVRAIQKGLFNDRDVIMLDEE